MFRKVVLTDSAGNPAFAVVYGIGIHAFKRLVKVASCNDIISRSVFLSQFFCQHFALGCFALPTVIGFQVEINQNQFSLGTL